ncbi:AraC family transcriptional regulator [Bacillus sp. SM2101]|uniref:helix-turn-helix domain-containing protein n=1 Tax=Bacillus sp. SM2101 TaxID=2805366 RepID=UPI002032E20C|nr:AraC family transcriptional regulator [Bacillus sp. SM2101]
MKVNSPKPSMGVLKFNDSVKDYTLTRYPPSLETSFFVKHFWIVSWDLKENEQFFQDVIPNPCVNLIVEQHKTGIFAPTTSKFSYLVKGKGRVVGVKFKPGGFYPFTTRSVAELTNKPLKIHDVFDIEQELVEETVLSCKEELEMIKFVENIIRKKLPQQDNNVTLVNQIIDHIISNHEIAKVDQICHQFNIHKRKLQRLFQQYVGVSPKWVIKLYRLQNAAEMIEKTPNLNWLQLCNGLGYYDQSHFIKDFKAIIGNTPDEFAKLS